MTRTKLGAGSVPSAARIARSGPELPSDVILEKVMTMLASVFERAARGEPPEAYPNGQAVEVWKDDEYAYLEAEIPNVNPDMELDLYLGNGVVFVRMRLEETADATISIAKPLERRRG